MKAFILIEKTREYLDYLDEHISNIQKSWKILQRDCKDMEFIYDDYIFNLLDEEIKNHDISKFSEFEFIQYRQKFFPIDSTEKTTNFNNAWEHHKKNNLHHWENWTTKEFNNSYEWKIHCVHMVIDWMAMGYKFGDTAKEYYENNKNKINLPKYSIDYIYEIFKRIYDNNSINQYI